MRKLVAFLALMLASIASSSCLDEIGYSYNYTLLEYAENCPEEDYTKVENYFKAHNIPYGSEGVYVIHTSSEEEADRDAYNRFNTIVNDGFSTEALDALELSPEFHFTYGCIRGIYGSSTFLLIGSYSYPAETPALPAE